MRARRGGPWDETNTDSEPGKASWLAKGNPEEMPNISDSNYHEGTTLSLWGRLCVYPHVLFFLLINTLFHYFPFLCGNSLSAKPYRPGPCHWPLFPGGLVARIWGSHCRGLTSIFGREPKSCFMPLQAEATWDQDHHPLIHRRPYPPSWHWAWHHF